MDELYMDREQCKKFDVSYADKDTQLYVAADAILRSRDPWKGYDRNHVELLELFGQRTLELEGIGHGWFRVKNVI